MALWNSTLGPQSDGLDGPREILRQSFLSFRSRVANLVSTIGSELPNLTVHDITHIDALWRVAGEIAGQGYPLNAAEAYVLGGAFLLHDAAHVLAAYPGRLTEIKQSLQWQDLVAHRRNGVDPEAGSAEEKSMIFQVLRQLHAEQAHRLPHASWKVDSQSTDIHLIEHYDLREYFGDLIGQVAASHHWAPSKVAAQFAHRRLSSPAFLAPATWEVDALKVALLLRTADAAHLDADRAPWFLFALRQPEGVSANHWRFQAKIGQPSLTTTGELRFTSGSSFSPNERGAWWLAFETARMVDRELQSAHEILQEERRPVFAAHRVLGTDSAASFSRLLPVRDWDPIDVAPKVGNIPGLIASLGGAALYGENSAAPLRELLQNGVDAVSALRSLGGASSEEGDVHVALKPTDEGDWWLEVTDTGIGMSRHVLTSVLLDFGTSLWTSDVMREELPGLAKSGFRPVGKFGIGFFSVFMLGREVRVTTRRYEQAQDGTPLHWQLRFEEGLGSRPVLVQPTQAEMLLRHGTRVAVRLSDKKLDAMLESIVRHTPFDGVFKSLLGKPEHEPDRRDKLLALLVARICPASPVTITTQLASGTKYLAVGPNDWSTLPDQQLLGRVGSGGKRLFPLTSRDGRLIGRLGFGGHSFDSCPGSIVYQGIVCGELIGLEGVVCAGENNKDARRTKAVPDGSLDDWRNWAGSVLGGSDKLDLDQKLRLHLLLPEQDLAVWIAGGGPTTLDTIMSRIESAEEIILHRGAIAHDDRDEVTSDRFSHGFEPAQTLICYPALTPADTAWTVSGSFIAINSSEAFPWFIGVESIDYLARFEAALKSKWGEFEVEELDDYPVGSVDGTEILRGPSRYFKG